MKFTKVESTCDAVRWFKQGDHPNVSPAQPYICKSKDGGLYYIIEGSRHPTFWLSCTEHTEVPQVPFMGSIVKFNLDGRIYYKDVSPFNFWSVKSGDTVPLDKSDLLYQEYCLAADWESQDYGQINNAKPGRSAPYNHQVVCPGDWIVTSETGSVTVLSDDDFTATYKPA